jgi:N utilization substance protein B
MASRRQTRQAAVQMLYWLHVSDSEPSAEDRDRFWTIVSEAARRQLHAATLRSALQLCQGHAERIAEWDERLPTARATVAAEPEAASLLDALDTTADLESRFTRALESLGRLDLDAPDDQAADRMEQSLAQLFAINRDIVAAGTRLLNASEDFPLLTPALEPVLGSLRRLARACERLQQIDGCSPLPDRTEFEALRKARKEVDGLREGAEKYVEAVHRSLESIDERLSSIVDNYSPERIDPVDRSILRLASWEILEDPDVPNPVAINEAVEIAKRMGSEDSARFVNGILDRLAREAS